MPFSVRMFAISAEIFSLPICVIMVSDMNMNKENELQKRKHPRLDNYDYSSAGAYFITIYRERNDLFKKF